MITVKQVFARDGRSVVVYDDLSDYPDNDEAALEIRGPQGGVRARLWLPHAELAELGAVLTRVYGGEES